MAEERHRYERKFSTQSANSKQIEHAIKLHPAIFTKAYPNRQINNIYFDTRQLLAYHTNIAGVAKRYKVRLRWYGKMFGKIEKPVLEIKIKNAHLGKKVSIPLKQFTLNEEWSYAEFKQEITTNKNIASWVQELFKKLIPTTLTSYERKYYVSANKQYRITIDNKLTTYRINQERNTFKEKHLDNTTIIVELKYDQEHHKQAKHITDNLNLRLTANSKYVNAIEQLKR